MESLFSTVAQISFTIVGLFFVALTVDSDSRNFWLGNKALNGYVTVNFFIMLLPGLISVGWLIPFSLFHVPGWLYVTFTLLVVYCFVYSELLKIYKSSAYKQIAHYEIAVDAKGILRFDILGLGALVVAGVYNAFENNLLSNSLNSAMGIYLFLLILSSIIPAYVFLRKNAEASHQKETLNDKVTINSTNESGGGISPDNTGIFYLFILLAAFVSFFVGKFLSKD